MGGGVPLRWALALVHIGLPGPNTAADLGSVLSKGEFLPLFLLLTSALPLLSDAQSRLAGAGAQPAQVQVCFLTGVPDLVPGPQVQSHAGCCPHSGPSSPLQTRGEEPVNVVYGPGNRLRVLPCSRVSVTSEEATPVSLFLVRPPGSLLRVGSPPP